MKLNQLLSWYESTRYWRMLSEDTKQNYRILIKQGVTLLGSERYVVDVTAEDADRLYDTLKETVSQHKAVSVCTILRAVWNVMLRYSKAHQNPFTNMRLGVPNQRTIIWTSDQVDQFIDASVDYGLPSIGLLLLMCYTFGQRPGDMRQLQWSAYDGKFLRYKQEKTKKDMISFVPEDIREILSLVDKVGPYIVTREDTGRPFTADDYLPIFKTVRSDAFLPETLQLRDARRSAITAAGANGATDSDLLTLGGHNVRTTLNVYQTVTEEGAEKAMKRRLGS